jgi:hypothetical protein
MSARYRYAIGLLLALQPDRQEGAMQWLEQERTAHN